MRTLTCLRQQMRMLFEPGVAENEGLKMFSLVAQLYQVSLGGDSLLFLLDNDIIIITRAVHKILLILFTIILILFIVTVIITLEYLIR